MDRVNFYVDGFNMYYGLKQKDDGDWQKFYWLNYVNLFQQFLGNNQILQKVVYFAAPPPLDSQGSTKGRERQKILFNANKILNPEQFELVMGQFYQKEITCKNCKQKFSVYEEKRTDVNIAIRLVGLRHGQCRYSCFGYCRQRYFAAAAIYKTTFSVKEN